MNYHKRFWQSLVFTFFIFSFPFISHALTISGDITCSNYTSGNIIVSAFDQSPFTGALPLDNSVLTSPGSYTLNNIPVGETIYLFALWDVDGDTEPSIGDYIGEYIGNPILTEDTTYINIDIDISHEITDEGNAILYLAFGDYELGIHELGNAYQSYEQGRTEEPNNPNANLMSALTELGYNLGNDYRDTDLQQVIDRFGNDFPNVIPADTPSVTECQDAISDHAIPYIDEAINLLQISENDPSFYRGMSAEMQAGLFGGSGSYKDKEWDYADTLGLEGTLHLVKGLLLFLTSYNLDVDWQTVYGDNFLRQPYLDANPTLFTLKSNGANSMQEARDEWISAFDDFLSSYDSINHETDDQSNDILTFSYMSNTDRQQIYHGLTQFKNSLQGDEIINPNDYLEPEKGENYWPDEPVTLNIGNFFLNPIDRTDLPQFSTNLHHRNRAVPFTLPDPTLNGILPNMTQERIDGFIRSDHPRLFTDYSWWNQSIYIHWNKSTYDDFQSYKLYRSVNNPEVSESSELIATITDPFQNWFEDTNVTSGNTYYYRVFFYYGGKDGNINNDNSTDIADVILCLRMAIGLDNPDLSRADMNNDGVVDITDVIKVLRIAIGLDNPLTSHSWSSVKKEDL